MPQPPRSQRQALQLPRGRLNESPKGHGTDNHAQDIGDIVTVSDDVAGAAAIDAAVLVRFQGAGEGGGDGGVVF